MTEEERRYTLEEAKAELAKQECAMRGHDFSVSVLMGHDGPSLVYCTRCGKTWPVGEHEA